MPPLARSPVNPFGRLTVTAAGTAQRLFSNSEITAAAQGVWPARASRIYLEALNTNTGFIYIGVSGMNKATPVGIIMTIPPPNGTKVVNFADFTENFAGGTNNYKLADYWIDSDVTGEGLFCRSVWVW